MDELPLVLLGLRSALKEDLECSPSELVYGTTICFPGKFFETPTSSAEQDVSGLLAHLCSTMAALRPKETTSSTAHHTHACGLTALFVCVCPTRCTPHTPTVHLNGPFRVLQRDAKNFTLDINGRQDTISVDHLKPAFVDTEFGLPEEAQHRNLHIVGRSRKGRVTRLPAKLLDTVA